MVEGLEHALGEVLGSRGVGVQAAVGIERGVGGHELGAVNVAQAQALALVAQGVTPPGERAAVRARLALVGAPDGAQRVDGRLLEALSQAAQVLGHVGHELALRIGVGPVVCAIGHDDGRGRVLAQGLHAAQGVDVKVVAGDGLVHEVEATGARHAGRPGGGRRAHHVALRDRVAKGQQVAALGRALDAAVGGEVAHRHGHEAGQVDAHLGRLVVGVVERERDRALADGGRAHVGAVDHEVDTVDKAGLGGERLGGGTVLGPLGGLGLGGGLGVVLARGLGALVGVGGGKLGVGMRDSLGKLDGLLDRGALHADALEHREVERDLVARGHEVDRDAGRGAGRALAPGGGGRLELLVRHARRAHETIGARNQMVRAPNERCDVSCGHAVVLFFNH